MNKQWIELIGRTVVKPELLTSKEGKSYAKVRIAVNKLEKDKEQKEESKATYYDILVFGKRAEKSQNLEKGTLMRVAGDMSASPYVTKDGDARVELTVFAREFHVLDTSIFK